MAKTDFRIAIFSVCLSAVLLTASAGGAESDVRQIGSALDQLQSQPNDSSLKLPVSIHKLGMSANGDDGRGALASYSRALDALPHGGPQMRGAREVAIYAQVSPSVVLILNGDTLGSGTLLDSDGLIVTNWHVVARAATVGVIFKPATEGTQLSKAQVVQGRVVRFDQVTDLALVQVSEVPPQAHAARLSTTAVLQVGDDVHAIGHPTGEAWT